MIKFPTCFTYHLLKSLTSFSLNSINYTVLFLFCFLFYHKPVLNSFNIFIYLFFSQIILHIMPHPIKSKRLTWGKRCHFALRHNSRSGKVPTEPLTGVEMVEPGLRLWGLGKLASITHTYLSVSLSISGISKTSSFNYRTLAFEIYYYQTLRIFLKKKGRGKNLQRGK